MSDLLPKGAVTGGDEYRALNRAAHLLAEEGLLQIARIPGTRYKIVAVGPTGVECDL